MIINAKKRLITASPNVTSVIFTIQPEDKELLDILKTAKVGEPIVWQGQDFLALGKDTVARFQDNGRIYQLITIEGNKGTVISLDSRLVRNMVKRLG